jgi:hypothetical protein
MTRILLRLSLIAVLCPLITGCAWFTGHKTQFAASGQLIATQAAAIAEKTVYSKALDAADGLLKGNNVAGFGDGLRSIEGTVSAQAIGQIPDTVMQLRQIWLGPQNHYTDLAAQVGQLIANTHPTTNAQLNSAIEGVIAGLQKPPPALVGP